MRILTDGMRAAGPPAWVSGMAVRPTWRSTVISAMPAAPESYLGMQAGYSCVDGGINTELGMQAGYSNVSGNYRVSIGHQAAYSSNADKGVCIGFQAGYYETGADKLFIDNSARASEADGRLKALIYGVFAAAVANQRLTINGNVAIQTPATGTSPLNLLTLQVGNAGLVSGDTYKDTAANILAAGDYIVGMKA